MYLCFLFFFTSNTTKLLKVTCYSCAETRHPRDCNVTTQCHAHQVSDRNSVQSPKIVSSLKIMVTISTCSNKNVILLYFWYWICSVFFDRNIIKKINNQSWSNISIISCWFFFNENAFFFLLKWQKYGFWMSISYIIVGIAVKKQP